ncbi:MAG TPA: aspartate aminotransferase family protein [Dehalococcoidia bacterium]|nr:aspartate aminotransferase family protein [Dehalococcoidia bacterium]
MNDSEYRSLVERDIAHLIHPQYLQGDQRNAIIFVKGEGSILTDVRGKQYIDGLSSLWNVAVGHGRRELAEAAAKQMTELAFANGYTGYSNIPAIELAERLCQISYPNMDAVFFANSGSEANEVAFKLARFYWYLKGRMEKVKIITRHQAYHGGTLATTAATGIPAFWRGFGPLDPTFIRSTDIHPYTSCTEQCAIATEETILREGPDTVAAVIAEPVQGAGGVIPPGADYFPKLREVCDKHDVLLISDEVITGFGRTGRWFALRHWNVQPDIVTFAKAVTSAYVPLSGAIVSRQIHEAILASEADRFMHGFTNSAHPTACAVGLRNLQIFDDENLVENAASLGERLHAGLRTLLDEDGVGDVRGLGFIAGVQIVQDKEKMKPFPIELNVGPRLVAACKERGLISRNLADNYLLAPPLVTTPEQVDQIVDILRDSIREVVAWARRQKPEI